MALRAGEPFPRTAMIANEYFFSHVYLLLTENPASAKQRFRV